MTAFCKMYNNKYKQTFIFAFLHLKDKKTSENHFVQFSAQIDQKKIKINNISSSIYSQ